MGVRSYTRFMSPSINIHSAANAEGTLATQPVVIDCTSMTSVASSENGNQLSDFLDWIARHPRRDDLVFVMRSVPHDQRRALQRRLQSLGCKVTTTHRYDTALV